MTARGRGYLMKNDLLTWTGLPEKGGTAAPRKRAATHPPTGVPAKGADTVAWVARPLDENVTVA